MKNQIAKADFYNFDDNNGCHTLFLKLANKNPDYIGKILPKEALDTPIYREIRFPSGYFNFYHFRFDLIKKNCEDRLDNNSERYKYLESCLQKFNKIVKNDPWRYIPCWIERTPSYLDEKYWVVNINGHSMPFPDSLDKKYRTTKKNGRIKLSPVDDQDSEAWKIKRNKYKEYLQSRMDQFRRNLEDEIKYYKSMVEKGVEEPRPHQQPKQPIKFRKKDIKKTKEIKPINWLRTEKSLAKLICDLSSGEYILFNNIWEIVRNHFIDRWRRDFNKDALDQEVLLYENQNRKILTHDKEIPLLGKRIPITWRVYQNQFGYFLYQLGEQGFVPQKHLFAKAINHFVREDGKKFNLKKLSQNLKKYGKYSPDTLPENLQPIYRIILNLPD